MAIFRYYFKQINISSKNEAARMNEKIDLIKQKPFHKISLESINPYSKLSLERTIYVMGSPGAGMNHVQVQF